MPWSDMVRSGFKPGRHASESSGVAYKDREKQLAAQRAHYAANKEAYSARRRAAQKQGRIEKKRLVLEYLQTHPCVDCGEADPIVLTFDHVRGEKIGNVGTMLSDNVAWTRIEDEIGKCDVRCSNCHMRRTSKQFGWAKALSL